MAAGLVQLQFLIANLVITNTMELLDVINVNKATDFPNLATLAYPVLLSVNSVLHAHTLHLL